MHADRGVSKTNSPASGWQSSLSPLTVIQRGSKKHLSCMEQKVPAWQHDIKPKFFNRLCLTQVLDSTGPNSISNQTEGL